MKNSEYYAVTKIYDYTVKVRKMSDTPVTMSALTLDSERIGHYEEIDEYNVFTFTPSEDGVYLFHVVNTKGAVRAYLYNNADMSDSSNFASKSDYDGSLTMRAVLTSGQTVYFKATGDNTYDSCDYTVSVVKKVVVPREPITLTLNTSADGNYTDPDDFDRFSFTATEAGTYKFTVENTSYTDMYAYLYSDAALTEQIAGGYCNYTDYGAKSTVSVNLTAGQTVYLAAKPSYEDDKFSYTAMVKPSQATSLTLDQTASGYYGSGDDCDFFSFTAEEDGYYRFSGQSYSEMRPELYSNPDMTGYIKSGSYSWGDNGASFSVGIDLTAGQTVYLKPVAEYSDISNFDFTVTVTKMNIGAAALVLNTPTAGHFENSESFSYFSFTATEAGTYYFTSDCSDDTQGYLYSDAALTDEIAYDDDSNGNYQFKIEYYLEEGQTVYLKPVEYGQDNSCDYTVTVSMN